MSANGATLSKLVLDGNTVTKTNNYSYASSTLTLRTEYLSTLDNGEYIFELDMSTGLDLKVKVIITD